MVYILGNEVLVYIWLIFEWKFVIYNNKMINWEIKIMSIACINRVKKELDMLANDPGPGISAWPLSDDNIMTLQVSIFSSLIHTNIDGETKK